MLALLTCDSYPTFHTRVRRMKLNSFYVNKASNWKNALHLRYLKMDLKPISDSHDSYLEIANIY